MMVAESPFKASVRSEIGPFHGLLVSFFFLSVGRFAGPPAIRLPQLAKRQHDHEADNQGDHNNCNDDGAEGWSGELASLIESEIESRCKPMPMSHGVFLSN